MVRNVFFQVAVETGNEAFAENPTESVAKMLEKLIERVREADPDQDGGAVRDTNGNTVGAWKLSVYRKG